ncbi:ROK family transcriptional regulator [Paraburkholderia sp. C35]|uniref:ROK family transcriptional regulator n=1 Tax=Paraburkholderia sp. C35 TaxID=2126993 RepID=UPI0013A591B0|nr:ROK family transcriptional regulator [Paraburkholderia sp. C35]
MKDHSEHRHTRKAPTPKVTRGPAIVRQGNEWAIYQHLLMLAPASSPQLAEATGLSKVTVSAALNNLERQGIVGQSGVRAGAAGRAPRLYAPRGAAGYVVAIDVGAEWIRGALADLTGVIVARLEKRTPSRNAQLVARIVEIVDAMLGEHAISRDDVLATILGSPGVLDPERGSLRLAANLPGWESSDLLASLRDALGPDIVIENDINLAALGEQKHGIGRGVDSFVFMSIGTGVGMGIVTDGKLHRGARGFAGEIAVLPSMSSAHSAGTKKARHDDGFEANASAKAIVNHAKKLGLDAPNAEAVFVAAAAGDARAKECVDAEARQLAWCLASIVPVLDPALIVFGGGIGRNCALLLPLIRDELAAWLPMPLPDFAISTTGTDGVLLGAIESGVTLAQHKAFERLGYEA